MPEVKTANKKQQRGHAYGGVSGKWVGHAGGRADNSDTIWVDSIFSVGWGAHGGALGAVRAADAHRAALALLPPACGPGGIRHRDPPPRHVPQPRQVPRAHSNHREKPL